MHKEEDTSGVGEQQRSRNLNEEQTRRYALTHTRYTLNYQGTNEPTDLCLLDSGVLLALLLALTPLRRHSLATIATFYGRRRRACHLRREPTSAPTAGSLRGRGLALWRRRRSLLSGNTAALGTGRRRSGAGTLRRRRWRHGFLLGVPRRRSRRRGELLLRRALDRGRRLASVKKHDNDSATYTQVSRPLPAVEEFGSATKKVHASGPRSGGQHRHMAHTTNLYMEFLVLSDGVSP